MFTIDKIDDRGQPMEIRNLITFVQVAELNSFTRAAKALDYSQSTVSFQIKQLETELGCLLFERINHTISLTEQGRMTLGMFERGLTYSLRTSIDEYLKRFAPQFRQERELVSSEEPLPGGGMLVRLKALEGERTLLEVDLTVASLEESLALRKNWQQRSAQLYDIIYDTLTKEEK